MRQIVQSGLRINHQSSLVWAPRAVPVAAILEHEHATAHQLGHHLRDGDAVSDVACVAVEHQHRCWYGLRGVRCADEVGRQLLAIGSGDLQVLIVVDAVVARFWNLGASIAGNVRRVYESPRGEDRLC